ncbi:hypothetical protein AAG906_038499 [Vitis piasezkii]
MCFITDQMSDSMPPNSIITRHRRPLMAFHREKSSTIENCTLNVTRLAWMGNTTSPREVVVAPLNLDNRCLGFSRMLHTSNLPTPNVKIKMSSCDCNTRLTFIEGKGLSHVRCSSTPSAWCPNQARIALNKCDPLLCLIFLDVWVELVPLSGHMWSGHASAKLKSKSSKSESNFFEWLSMFSNVQIQRSGFVSPTSLWFLG